MKIAKVIRLLLRVSAPVFQIRSASFAFASAMVSWLKNRFETLPDMAYIGTSLSRFLVLMSRKKSLPQAMSSNAE